MAALGTGIGNTAAHELGHQFQGGKPTLPYMDCGHGGTRPCENGNNYIYNFFSGSGFPQIPFTGIRISMVCYLASIVLSRILVMRFLT
jgi:hypothetical protein